MRNTEHCKSLLLLAFLLLFVCGHCFAKPFVLGKISDNPKKHYGYLKPMANYIADHLQEFGYTEGKVLMARNNEQMIQFMLDGRIDMVTETLFTAVELHDKANAESLVLKWKKGAPTYYSIIFVRKDSEIETLSDLKGKIIAFEDEGSTTAFYVPAAEILNAKVDLEEIPSVRATRDDEKLSYIFSGDEINTSVMVHKRIVHAGAYNDHDWNKDDHLPKNLRRDLKIIHKSKILPRAVEVVPKSMPNEVKQKLKETLIKMHEDSSAKTILKAYQRTTRFEALADNFPQHIEYARKVLKAVNEHLDTEK